MKARLQVDLVAIAALNWGTVAWGRYKALVLVCI